MSEVKLVNFRATPEEIELWNEAAHQARKSRTAWMCEVLNEAATGIPPFIPPIVVIPTSQARKLAGDLKERAAARAGKKTKSTPGSLCEHRIPEGSFCKKCGGVV